MKKNEAKTTTTTRQQPDENAKKFFRWLYSLLILGGAAIIMVVLGTLKNAFGIISFNETLFFAIWALVTVVSLVMNQGVKRSIVIVAIVIADGVLLLPRLDGASLVIQLLASSPMILAWVIMLKTSDEVLKSVKKETEQAQMQVAEG